MRIRQTLLSPEEQAAFDAAMLALKDRTFDSIKRVLLRLPEGPLQQLTYELAFKPGPVLPKRDSRPQLTICHLTDQVYLACAPDGPHRDLLMDVAICVQEYYDILDDVIDGDVAEGGELQAILVTQLIMPAIITMLGELGPEATTYFGERSLRMVRSVYDEKLREKSREAYMDSLRAQSWFFGYCTGLAALVAGEPPAEVERAEEIGRLGYQWAQFFLDVNQKDDEDNWNALHFMAPAEALEIMRGWYTGLCEQLAPYPAERQLLIKGLFSLDLDAAAKELAELTQDPGDSA